jgi:isoquinoline 1-oxidoreductase beta subunit
MLSLVVNGRLVHIDRDPKTPLLWVLRDALGLKGAKYGCGVGECGACTVHVDGAAVHACVFPAGDAAGRRITTIEGLARDPSNPVIRAWVAERVPQCGYCQPGMVMAASALLAETPKPDDREIDAAMAGVLCRCGTYQRVRRAIHRAARGGRAAGPRIGRSALLAPPEVDTVALNPWVRIAADGTVVVVVDRSEMGQGVTTAFAMLVAEELEVDPARVRVAFAPADRIYANPYLGRQVTGGSTSVRGSWEPLRRAAATARAQLVAAAAELWQARPADCHADDGAVVHRPSGRRLGYGEVAGRAAAQPAPRTVPLKQREDFRLIGRPLPRIDAAAHATGATEFGWDVAIPGAAVAVVSRCPTFGGSVARFDARRARIVPGVRDVVAIESGIAVVADDFPAALAGRQALDVAWRRGALGRLDTAAIRRRFARAARRTGEPVTDVGDANRALAKAARVVEATYETPYLAHATLEPMNCTARIGPDGCDVWVPTQAQTEAQEVAARAAGVPRNRVRVHTTWLGGGFGRRLTQDFVAEAVQVAKAAGLPVQVLWTRADDLQHDHYRPGNYTRLRGGLDAAGGPVAWFQRIAGPPLALGGVDLPYDIANVREEHVEEDPGIPTGPWRSVGESQNAFAVESFVDELAHAAGADPFVFRRDLLAEAPRHRAVLELAAEKVGWGAKPPRGRYRGIAVYRSYGSWVAEVAEVSVSRAGKIRVHRVVCAIDCGTVVNPDIVAAQLEGAVVFGLTAALKGEITFQGGGAVEHDFRDYPLLTIADAPEVEVHIVPSDEHPGGVGEPGVPPIAPAVANAVFAATGQRLRTLPLRVATTPPASSTSKRRAR